MQYFSQKLCCYNIKGQIMKIMKKIQFIVYL